MGWVSSSGNLQSYFGSVPGLGSNGGAPTVAGHAVDDAALDAHPVVGDLGDLESLAPVPDEDLDPLLVDLGVDVDLVGAGMLGGVHHGLSSCPHQCLQWLRGVAVAH